MEMLYRKPQYTDKRIPREAKPERTNIFRGDLTAKAVGFMSTEKRLNGGLLRGDGMCLP